uniref:At2g35280-like TPR domain-containing protein n=1 Tax=Lactuca sativa TaxID=4236 RepID=A0A9R1VB70_LACSA|nr:hypothetical protein LSAT_V11C600310990 [Lactuca sativa]
MDEVIRRGRKFNNPHILFKYGIILFLCILLITHAICFMYLYLFILKLYDYLLYFRRNEAGNQLLQDAADKEQLDAIFVMGMLLMAEGSERKQEGLIMLNNAYIITRRIWNRFPLKISIAY